MEQLAQIDLQVFNFINHTLACTPLDFICVILRDKLCMGAVYIGIAYAVFTNNPNRFLQLAIAGGLVYLLTDQVSASVVKKVFERVRPCNDTGVGARLILQQCGSGFSFVSAHAANVFGTVAFLFFTSALRNTITTIIFVWAAAVCFSQVYVGVHYPADVLGGALLGVLLGGLGAVAVNRFQFKTANNSKE